MRAGESPNSWDATTRGAARASATQATSLGSYTLFGVIARGGMATVHFARKAGGPLVAVKRLHPQYAHDASFIAMFVDEARLASQVRHRNVVMPLDIGISEGELFVVFEYVAGAPLSRLFQAARDLRSEVPPAVASAIVCDALSGLHAAHEARSPAGEPLGIVHRDVSPQNILVGSDGVARLIDFGIAIARARLQETRENQFKGKLSYTAPEQLRGKPATRRSDVYAATAVLWEALTSQRLFHGEHEGAIVEQILIGLVDPPSKHVPALSAEIDAVVLKGLSSAPDDRFATAAEMADALTRALPPAPAVEVAAWIESVYGESLAKSAQRVAEIEQSRPEIESTDGHAAQGTNGAHRKRSVIAPALLGVAAVVAVAGGVLAYGARGRATEASDAAATTTAVAGPATSSNEPLGNPSPPSSASTELPAPLAEDSSEAATARPEASRPGSAVRTPSGRNAGAPGRRGSSGQKQGGVDCSIPFTLDEQGRRVFRRECL